MNEKDMIPVGKPVQVPIPEKGKTLDYDKEISAEEMIKSVSYERIIKAIMNMENNFIFNHIKMDIKEVEKNRVFHNKYYYIPNDYSKFVEEDITIEDELEGRKWHKMSKEPQNVFTIMIAKRLKEGDTWDTTYITEYSRKANGQVVLGLFVQLIDIFMEWKDIKTIRKMMDYVENSERISNARNDFKMRYRLRKDD